MIDINPTTILKEKTMPERADAHPDFTKVPVGYIPCESLLPENDRPVLAIRRSACLGAEFEILTARYMPGYRPLKPWRTLFGDDVEDCGYPIMGWRYADKLLISYA